MKMIWIGALVIILLLNLLFLEASMLDQYRFAVIGLEIPLFVFLLACILIPHRMAKKKTEIILLFSAIILFFLVFEAVLRVSDCTLRYDYGRTVDDVQYRHFASSSVCHTIYDNDKTYRRMTNSEGFIDDEFSDSEDVVIYLLGDSFAECLQADYENCAHVRLERGLKERGQNASVLNFGISGFGTFDEVGVLKHYAKTYPPDLVILFFLPQNDLTDNQRYLDHREISNDHFLLKKTIKRFTPITFEFLHRKMKNAYGNVLAQVSPDASEKFVYKHMALENYGVYAKEYTLQWENLWQMEYGALSELKKLTEESGARLLLVSIPAPEQANEEYWEKILQIYPSLKGQQVIMDRPNSLLEKFSQSYNISYLDLLPYFANSKKHLYWEFDGHWNDDGQLLAADIITSHLIEQGLVGSPSAGEKSKS